MQIVAYIAALVSAPIAQGIFTAVVGFPVAALLKKSLLPPALISLAISIPSGFIALWAGFYVYGMFGYSPSLLLALLLGGAFFLNGVYRINTRPWIHSEVASLVGDLAGITMGVLLLL